MHLAPLCARIFYTMFKIGSRPPTLFSILTAHHARSTYIWIRDIGKIALSETIRVCLASLDSATRSVSAMRKMRKVNSA